MDTIDSYDMQEAEQIVHKHRDGLPFIHTVTITLNDNDPQVTIEGFTSDQLDEHLKITYWRGEKTVERTTP
jgi:hypothetical protein